jgi:hypothetical protein
MNVVENNIYQANFSNSFNLAGGMYLIQYVGSKEKQTIKVVKQ